MHFKSYADIHKTGDQKQFWICFEIQETYQSFLLDSLNARVAII